MKPTKTGVKRGTALKICPSCSLQLPTACKSCTCGHSFRKPVPVSPTVDTEAPTSSGNRRRTERTRRERPHYFSHLEYEHQHHYKPRRKPSESTPAGKRKRKPPVAASARAKLLFKSSAKVTNDDSNSSSSDDVFANISTERALQLAIILADVNRKYVTQNFKP